MREGVEDVVFCFLRFPSGLAAHLHLSWLDPHKERRFTVVGEQRMATFDDMALEGKITVYDKGFDQHAESYGEYITRSGDIWSPRLSNEEPLRTECAHFVDAIRNGTTPDLRRRVRACASCASSRGCSGRWTRAAATACARVSRPARAPACPMPNASGRVLESRTARSYSRERADVVPVRVALVHGHLLAGLEQPQDELGERARTLGGEVVERRAS